ncbi:MAG: hypothetical protein IT582_03050 [Opitutaceae bacterium]|nr:hypothetical protein [Opitutaceae bacterium]
MDALKQAAADLIGDWAKLLAPHYGPSGSMDLDLRDWPTAHGPSYYNQFTPHALLLLATGRVPGCDQATRARYLDLALRNIDYTLSITDEEFHTPHYSRGREWGRHIGEWLNFYLLCALEILEQDQLGSAELRQRLSHAVLGATGALHKCFVEKYRTPPREFVGNHDTWHGLLFYRAGRHFDRLEWMDYARDFFTRCVHPFQHRDGYWPEGEGIVVGYSMVTALAVSVYAELSGEQAAHASIGRFLGFLEYSELPDGSSAVVLDVRMRYHRAPFLFLPPGLLACAEGRQMALQRMRAGRSHLNAVGVCDNGAQAFAFFGSFAEFAFADRSRPAELAVSRPIGLPAARLSDEHWRAYLGWQVVPDHPSRFVLDTQNFVEIWHAAAGYLVGTGGSKFMPRFSTVRRTKGGRAYIPDRAYPVRITAHEAEVALAFSAEEVTMRLTLTGGGCCVSARQSRGAPDAELEFGLILALRKGDTLEIDGATETIDPSVLIHEQGCPRPVRLMWWRGLEWTLPTGARLDYPLVPHNSYTQDGLPKPEDYVGRLSFPLSTEWREITMVCPH